jgi:Pyruvate/2-oxoacid:ferredoxin oxidoreductase delta subunit
MPDNNWYTLARRILKAGGPPVPINENLIDLLKTLINEDQVKFLLNFRKPLNFEEIQKKSGLDEIVLNETLATLMNVGLLTGIPSRTTGIMVYRLVAFLPGLLEFTLMRGESGPKQKKIAKIWEQIFNDATEMTQNNYDIVVNAFKNAPAIDHVIPIGEELELSEDTIIPNEEIEKILDKFEVFSVSYCYCRHRKNLLGDPCKINAPLQNCLSFGRTARFVIDHGFAKEITRNESLKILKEAEELGLVHKTFHANGDPELEELAICNCCQCCCGSFGNFYRGAAPTSTMSSYIANINQQSCIACGICYEVCPMSAPILLEDHYVIDIEKCLGCGVCTQKCPELAIKLQKTDLRRVFIPPKKIPIHL